MILNVTLDDINEWSKQSTDELIMECRLAGQNCNWLEIRTERGLCHQLRPTEQQLPVTKPGQCMAGT